MESKNLSNGIKDGILILYMKNGRVRETELSESQIKVLDFVISNTLEKPIKISSKCINIIDGEIYD